MAHSNPLLVAAALVATTAPTTWASPDDQQTREATDEAVESIPAPDQDLLVREMAMVWFGFDSARLTDAARRTLDAIAADARATTNGSIVIEGHADPIGADDYNQALGERRAANVRDYLIAQGVPADRVEIVSFGEQRNISATNRANRRVIVRPMMKLEPRETEPPPPSVVTIGPPKIEPVPVPREVPEDIAPMDIEPPPVAERAKPAGLSIAVGGGIVGFLDGDTRDYSEPGGLWEVRVAYGTRSRLAFEAAYNGTAQDIDALGLDSAAILLGQGVEGTMRINLFTERALQPYGFAGVGYTHYSIENADTNTSDVRDSEDTVRIPFGLGLGYRMGALRLDVRGTIRQALDDEIGLTRGVGSSSTSLSAWSTDLKLGWEF